MRSEVIKPWGEHLLRTYVIMCGTILLVWMVNTFTCWHHDCVLTSPWGYSDCLLWLRYFKENNAKSLLRGFLDKVGVPLVPTIERMGTFYASASFLIFHLSQKKIPIIEHTPTPRLHTIGFSLYICYILYYYVEVDVVAFHHLCTHSFILIELILEAKWAHYNSHEKGFSSCISHSVVM